MNASISNHLTPLLIFSFFLLFSSDGDFQSRYNPVAQDFLLKLPGVDSKNINRLMKSVANIRQLVTKSRDDLTTILGSGTNADKLFDFLHQSQREVSEKEGRNGGSRMKGSGNGSGSGKGSDGGSGRAVGAKAAPSARSNFKYFKRKK